MNLDVEYFLWVDGIPGDCQHPSFRNWHELHDFVWSSGETEEEGAMQCLIAQIPRTGATPGLKAAAARAEPIPKAVITSVRVQGESRRLAAKIIMLNVRLRRYHEEEVGDLERPRDSVTVHFDKVQFVHYP